MGWQRLHPSQGLDHEAPAGLGLGGPTLCMALSRAWDRFLEDVGRGLGLALCRDKAWGLEPRVGVEVR